MIGYAYIYITYKGPFFNLAKGPEKHRAGPPYCSKEMAKNASINLESRT